MPKPSNELERVFRKHTFTGKLAGRIFLSENNQLQTGLDGEFQHNRREGWGFIIPDFETLSTGLFAVDKWTVSDVLSLNAGARYDYVRTSIHSYQDWYPTEGEYKQRSADILRNFNSLTWSAGLSWTPGRWVLKANAGKSFRVPIPKELGADGVNYHIFRYEKGNADLSPEESYQLDLGINYLGERVTLRLDPFLNWFPNYIYLNPSADYYEGLQRYAYTQAQVLRAGAEAQLNWHIFRFLEAEAKGEYLFARQMSGEKKGYGLPFSPPWGGDVSLKYTFLEDGFVSLGMRFAGRQEDIVPPEKPTDGWWTLNAQAGKDFHLGETTLKVALQADNLLNKRYYDHTSYYRLIGVPEPGIGASLMLGLEF